jgi:polar amino acid transport system substrate-binding protein
VTGSGLAAVAADLAPSGVLRASINLGNPVLAQGTPETPTGVTVEIARELGQRLGRPVELICFDAAIKSFEAMRSGRADICFLAIEPARAAEVAFTPPYVIIEGVFVVPDGSGRQTPADVDQDGVRIGVNQGSAYDLFLTRNLSRAELVRGNDGVRLFQDLGLEATAGIRAPLTEFVSRTPGYRVIEERFMEIRQALGTSLTRSGETMRFLTTTIEELKSNGFVADALRRAGQVTASVAPASTA